MDWQEKLVIAGIGGFLALFIFVSVMADLQMDRYLVAHHCEKVGIRSGQLGTGVGVGANGQATVVTVSQPDQTIYSCDSGEMIIH